MSLFDTEGLTSTTRLAVVDELYRLRVHIQSARSLAQADVATQLREFKAIVRSNVYAETLLSRLAELDLPGWHLTAGCLFQTVWNALSGRDPTAGIRDYDVFYFDEDASWQAEDEVIRSSAESLRDLPVDVEVRNQARVHLWYPEKFGISCPPLTSAEDGIDSFLATACCLGVRQTHDGDRRVYAPRGFTDLYALVVRPNNLRGPRHVYESKAERWLREWPQLHVLPWPIDDRPERLEQPPAGA